MPPLMGPTRITIEAPSVTLAGWDYGNEGAPPMVLVHGLTDLAWSLHPVAAAFADRYHVVSYDLRGHGDSGQPGRYAVANFVSDLRVVIAELGLERPVLLGHSLGSMVSSWYAGTWPDDPAALVMLEGLGPPPRVGDDDPDGRVLIAQGIIDTVTGDPTRRPMADIEAADARLARAHPALDDARRADLTVRSTRLLPDGGLGWKFDPYVRDWSATFTREAQEDRWKAIRCPVLILSGADAWERWWKPSGESRLGPGFDGPMATAERDRRLGCFADVEHHEVAAGHMVHYDAPDRVVALAGDFLDRRLGRPGDRGVSARREHRP